MIGSPGTGVQQRASLTHTSSTPLTTTPGSVLERRLRRPRLGGAAASISSAAGLPPPAAEAGRAPRCDLLGGPPLAAERGDEFLHDVLPRDVALADRRVQGGDVGVP